MNSNKILFYIFSLLAISFFSCHHKNENTPYDYSNHTTKILGHRGYGIKGYNDTLMDNTLEAIIKAIKTTDGVEVDIQMSKNGTIWLYHDTGIPDKDSNIKYIPRLTNDEIRSVFSLNHPNVQFNNLQEVFTYFDNHKITKTISLDIKSFYGEDCFKNTTELNAYMLIIGEKIIELARKYSLENQILVESDIRYLLDLIKTKSSIKTFLLGYSDFKKQAETARKNHYSGVSHFFNDPEINATSIENAQKSGIKVQLWTPNSKEELESVLLYQPDFLQTDNIHYFENNL